MLYGEGSSRNLEEKDERTESERSCIEGKNTEKRLRKRKPKIAHGQNWM